MIGLVRQWLLGVTAAALVLALAEALAPEGGAKRVCRLAGGLALLLAAAGPAAGPVAGALKGGLPAGLPESWRERTQAAERELEERSDRFYLAIIEEETAAYVRDKARELGFDCEAEVTYGYDEQGVPCPWEIAARGSWTQEQREELSRLLEEELGVPARRQYYEERQP